MFLVKDVQGQEVNLEDWQSYAITKTKTGDISISAYGHITDQKKKIILATFNSLEEAMSDFFRLDEAMGYGAKEYEWQKSIEKNQ